MSSQTQDNAARQGRRAGRTSHAARLQIGFVALLLVCVAQLGWWIYDQWTFTRSVTRRMEQSYEREARAARELESAGVGEALIADQFPELERDPDGGWRVRAEVREDLADESFHRLNRYSWEGAFFLLVLVGAIAVVWRAVAREIELRQRQQNFVAAVTHELKSPLAGMRLAAETLELGDPARGSPAELVARILDNLDRIERTVGHILDVARIEEGRYPVELRPMPLEPAVVAATRTFEGRARHAEVELRAEIGSGIQIVADPEAVVTVLVNLLDNALRAASSRAEGALVEVSAERRDGTVAVTVSDNGKGFDPRESERLFEKFYRPGDELRREGRGTGLGLYLARELVDRCGGTIEAHSEGPGRGADFTVEWIGAGDEPS